ncbi:hypothetical protein B0T10DRAFT_550310 [Thelonectria olida]|uniref:Shugoshin n=1 Tax=Thelonectria olida TaxID=1576542 RepID=A0A9P8W2B9_9HYPO|nr:hypothetical protein B0T10DRAFT_550310 [Thelonectria olida]
MARLNEPPVSMDSLETLRKKLLRQNRDLAKSNNVRALRIRELENDCAYMLSENLGLRSRILELEKELEDNDTRRIADHALVIKEKLESQLTEWGTLLAGLGLEPPMKRHSPRIRKSTKSRISFSSARPSPSQRRLRDVARDIEELGHISEQRSYPRMSLNPDQIRALQSEADSADSPELGPPPMSHFIDEDPVKVDSPSRPYPMPIEESPKVKMEPPVTLESPQSTKFVEQSPSPQKKRDVFKEPKKEKPKQPASLETPAPQPAPQPASLPAPQPTKAGSKRKLAARDDMVTSKPQLINDENQDPPPRPIAGKQSIREKVGNRTLKELANTRKEAGQTTNTSTTVRKPLAVKSTNDDISSPRKTSKPPVFDEIAAAKAEVIKTKNPVGRPRSKPKNITPVVIEAARTPSELGTPVTEPAILSPSSPETASGKDATRGGTPPPTDINANRDPPRPSRRNRATVSYAEPNLRDKMRRPTKELYDAVTGEGKYSRRSSNIEIAPESAKVKREDDLPASWKKLPPAPQNRRVSEDVPASPLAGKGSSPIDHPRPIPREKGRRTSMLIKESVFSADTSNGDDRGKTSAPTSADSSQMSEADIYEFTTCSPQPEKEAKKKMTNRRASRRVSSVVTGDDDLAIKERASRRRSMML